MNRVGIANLPLHHGSCPAWLFKRMVELAKEISEIIVLEYSRQELLRRLSDPFFFQALGCVAGFDFHSSGLTTTLCGALKEGLKQSSVSEEVVVCGGKGRMSLRTPQEIVKAGGVLGLSSKKIEELVTVSKLVAKIDNSCVQDGYTLYHHCFLITQHGRWCVIQQGMNASQARRYHWLNTKKFFNDPHQAVCCDEKKSRVLNLSASKSVEARKTSLDLIKDNPIHLRKYFNKNLVKNKSLLAWSGQKELNMPSHHLITRVDISERGWSFLKKAYECQPRTYEELLGMRGIGGKTLRALALISELVYGSELSWEDPVKYSYAHGGKDGTPYPVNTRTYDKSIGVLKEVVQELKLGVKDKSRVLRRLNQFMNIHE